MGTIDHSNHASHQHPPLHEFHTSRKTSPVTSLCTSTRETGCHQSINKSVHNTGAPAQAFAFPSGKSFGWRSPRIPDTPSFPPPQARRRGEMILSFEPRQVQYYPIANIGPDHRCTAHPYLSPTSSRSLLHTLLITARRSSSYLERFRFLSSSDRRLLLSQVTV